VYTEQRIRSIWDGGMQIGNGSYQTHSEVFYIAVVARWGYVTLVASPRVVLVALVLSRRVVMVFISDGSIGNNKVGIDRQGVSTFASGFSPVWVNTYTVQVPDDSGTSSKGSNEDDKGKDDSGSTGTTTQTLSVPVPTGATGSAFDTLGNVDILLSAVGDDDTDGITLTLMCSGTSFGNRGSTAFNDFGNTATVGDGKTNGYVDFFGTTDDSYFLLDANINSGFDTTHTGIVGPPGQSGNGFAVPFP
jgi:hypothetical protein